MMKNNRYAYGSISKGFHWTMSAIIVSLLVAGFIMINLNNSPTKWQIYDIHKSFGLLILLLIPLRTLWRLVNTTPNLDMMSSSERRASKTGQALLYAMMFTMPISGWVMSTAAGYTPKFFSLFTVAAPVAENKQTAEMAGNIHFYTAFCLVTILIMHIGGALKCHLIDKNKVLTRMLPGKKMS